MRQISRKKGILTGILLSALLCCAGCGAQSAQAGTDGSAVEPSASGGEARTQEESIEEILQGMTLEEKAAQLFIVLPEDLVDGVDCVIQAGDATREGLEAHPVGGVIYMEQNLESAEQVQEMLANVQQFSRDRIGLPLFLGVDEEGGTVARVAGSGNFDVPDVGNMADIDSVEQAEQAGETIGKYLSELGFNLDFAPDADVWSNPDNEIVKYRSFGDDPQTVSERSLAVLDGLQKQGVCGVLKHFPGHGATEGDTHEGYAYTSKTLEELEECELIPFQNGVDNGAPMMMAAHISLPNVIGDDTPASLSEEIITGLLREQMGYDGVVVTDAMNMGAIAQNYSSEEAAVKALAAGADLILMPEDFAAAYQGVLDAVQDGTLTEERLDQSLRRILKVKLEMPS
ncbi:MAG: glycoside hydrolase family 3 protein [Eubacteriales bacterium]|nr:glycoside hydrolase family 3 protein [Eubacteriales bacterium]